MKSLEKLRNLKSFSLLDSEKQKVIGGETAESIDSATGSSSGDNGVFLYYCWYKSINTGEVTTQRPFSSRNGTTCPHYSGYFKCTSTGEAY